MTQRLQRKSTYNAAYVALAEQLGAARSYEPLTGHSRATPLPAGSLSSSSQQPGCESSRLGNPHDLNDWNAPGRIYTGTPLTPPPPWALFR